MTNKTRDPGQTPARGESIIAAPIGVNAERKPGLGGLPPDQWDGLAAPHFYSSAAWLNFCAMHGGGEQTAVIAHTQGEPTAAVPVCALTKPPFPLYRWNEVLGPFGLPALPNGGVLVGPRQGYLTHFLIDRGADRTAAVSQLVEQLRDTCRARARTGDAAACVAMYLTTDDARAVMAAGIDALPVALDADAWLELPPGGWEAWVQSLSSHRRRRARLEARQFRDAGYTVTHGPLADWYEQLPGLAQSTQAKYGHASAAADWLKLLRLHVDGMGSAAQVSVCRIGGGDPVGFCLYYVWGETMFLRWAGFDYDRLAGAAEYFNLVFYDHIGRAPELGIRRLHAGIKAPEAKALRGAELRPLWLVDLSEHSALARHAEAIRRHNRALYERLLADPRTRAAVCDHDSWLAFC